MAVIKEITLDVNNITQFVVARIQQGNAIDMKINVSITEDNEPYIVPETSQVILRMLKKDGKPIFNTCDKLGENKVQFTITPEISVLDGRCPAKIQIIDSATGGDLRTIEFHILIDKDVYDDSLIESTGQYTALEDALLRVGDTSNAIINAENATADAIEATQNAINATIGVNDAINELNQTNTNVQNAEDIRIANENTRISNEDSRALAETDRESSESTRKSNENTRETNELARENNEQTRESNETERQDYYNAYKVCEPYNSSKQYVVGNKVTYGGSTYQCILDCSGVVPINTTNWLLIASKGADGTGGDMMSSVYDPTGKANDAYDSANHSYSNTSSNLSSTNTQSAIDELDSIIGDKSQLQTTSNTDLVSSINANTLYINNVYKKTLSLESSKTKWVSHRGFLKLAPENTIPAYELAIQRGYYALETDVCRTLDGHFVLMHDPTVDRMTNGTGNIADLTLAEIQALIIDTGNNIASYPNLKVPTLEEFLTFCRVHGAIPILDLRLGMAYSTELITVIRNYDMEHRCIIINSDLASLQSIRGLSSTIMLQALFNLTSANIDICAGLNMEIDVPYAQVTSNLIKEAHSKGVKVNAWTISNYTDADNLINMGIDYITVNDIYPTERNQTPQQLKSFSNVISIVPNIDTILSIPNAETDFSTTLNNEITIKKSGIYLLIAKFSIQPDTSVGLGSIFKNGTSVEGQVFHNTLQTFSSWNKYSIVRTESLKAGDKLSLKIKHNSSTNLNSQWSLLEMVLLQEAL